jgi:hypothetical protein
MCDRDLKSLVTGDRRQRAIPGDLRQGSSGVTISQISTSHLLAGLLQNPMICSASVRTLYPILEALSWIQVPDAHFSTCARVRSRKRWPAITSKWKSREVKSRCIRQTCHRAACIDYFFNTECLFHKLIDGIFLVTHGVIV